jgi:hypothetical protein
MCKKGVLCNSFNAKKSIVRSNSASDLFCGQFLLARLKLKPWARFSSAGVIASAPNAPPRVDNRPP